MAKAKSTEDGISAIEAKLLGYTKCGDHTRLAAIAEYLGFPVDTLLKFLKDKDADEAFLEEISKAIDETATRTSSDSKGSTLIADLNAVFYNNKKTGFKFETTDCLPTEVFNELAQLTSNYSTHRSTKTVTFSKEKLAVDKKAAFPDSGKDTYKDNGDVAKNYVALIGGILRHAEEHRSSPAVFSILATLYHALTSLHEEACNQENAADFATVLQKFTPRHHKGKEDTHWRDKIASGESVDKARTH